MGKPLAAKNIYIIGAQCTGKTTLVNAVEKSFEGSFDNIPPPAVVREVARSVLKQHGFTAEDITSNKARSSQLQSLILDAQFRSERDALTRAPWIISDRSGLDPLIYARRHVGPETAEAMLSTEHWRELFERMSESLIFVCEAGADFLVDDGVRLMPKDMQDWRLYHKEFCQMLGDVGLSYHVVPSSMLSIDERLSFVWLKWREEQHLPEPKM